MTDDKDTPNNVIAFPSVKEMRESGGPVSRKQRTYAADECVHSKQGVYVCADTRKVTCKKCGTELDPIQALSELARNWDWEEARRAKRMAVAEATRLKADVERLKRQRSQARRAGGIPVASVRLAFDDVIKRLRANASNVKAGGWTAEAVCKSAATTLEFTRDKLLHGAIEQEEAQP